MKSEKPRTPTTMPTFEYRELDPSGLRTRIAGAVGTVAATGSLRAGIENLRDPNGVENGILGMIEAAGFTPNNPTGIDDPATFSRKVELVPVVLRTDETSNPNNAFIMAPAGAANFHDSKGGTHLSGAVRRIAGKQFEEKIGGARGRVISRAARYLVNSGVVGKIESSRSDRLRKAKKEANAAR